MKTLTFLLTAFVLMPFSMNAKKGLEIKIVDATLQYWVAGVPGGGHGQRYTIKVYVNTSKEINITRLWIGEEKVPFQVEFVNYLVPKKIALGDSLLLDYNKPYNEKKSANPSELPPVKYKGAALIECSIAGKLHYFIVKDFRKLADMLGQ